MTSWRKLLARARLRWTIGALFTVGLIALSLAPLSVPSGPQPIPQADKVAHFLLYALYAALILGMLFPYRRGWKPILWTVAYCALFGALMEALQGAFPALGRQACVADAAANALGAMSAGAVFGLVRRKVRP